MRTKTAYREKPQRENSVEAHISPPETNNHHTEPENNLHVENIAPAAAVEISSPAAADEGADAVAAEIGHQQEADAAKFALQRQIEALRQSEALQREAIEERAAQVAQLRPPTREQKLEHWRANGVSEDMLRFLQENPTLIDHDAIREAASPDAIAAGVDPESREFLPAVKQHFEKRWRHVQAAGAAQSPQFFAPPPPQEPRVPSRGAMVSAGWAAAVPARSR